MQIGRPSLIAETLLFGGKTKEAGATADKVSSAYRNWLEKLTYAVRMSTPKDCNYVKVHSESLVGLFTCVFVRTDQKDTLRGVDICTVKRGLGNIYGNKVGDRLGLRKDNVWCRG